jgi:NAD(P)-dependent dehydrogenase (short-subunit alcohol dehydrogenase family)
VVINISRLSGVRSTSWNGNTIAYGVTKAGRNHLTTLLAACLGPEIRVNALIPGMVVEAGVSLGPVGSVVARATPLGRPGSPVDLGDACVFLALSRYITGESIMIDGGLSLWTFGERTSLEPDAR